jgi:dihydrofolate reductase
MVAMAENRVIGRNNNLPWYLPEDLKYFKKTTMGKPIIMGRKTYESIGKPLPGRTNIVVTRNANFTADGVRVVHSLDDAIALATQISIIDGSSEAIVIGGGQIYQAALPLVETLYVTQVHAKVEGDAFFPEVNWQNWQEFFREDWLKDEKNPYDYSFVILKKTV